MVGFRIARRFLREGYGRLTLTVFALASGVALICAFDLASRAVVRAFTEVIDTMAGRAALQVSPGEGGLFPEETVATVRQVAGVELAVPVVTGAAFTVDESGELLTVHGVDIAEDAAVRVYGVRDEDGLQLEDPLMFLSQPDSVALTRTFAKRRGLDVGDRIALETPTGRRRFTVRALLDAGGVARVYGGNLVVMDLWAAEAAFTRPGYINRVDVVVARDMDVGSVRDAIATALPPGLRVEAPAQRKADLHKVMFSFRVLLQGVGLIGLVAAFLIAFNRLATVFAGRTWQVGMLRAVGVSTPAVWRELLKEGLLLGAAGAVVGIPLGIGLGWLVLPAIAETTALNFKLVATEAELAIRPESLLWAAGLGLGTALLAAALPAWTAARVPAVQMIGRRGLEQMGVSSKRSLLMCLAAAAGIVIAVALQSSTQSPVWGLLATLLIAIVAALAAQPFLHAVRTLLMPAFRWLFGPASRFVAMTLLHNSRRAGLTIATLGVGVGAVLWLWTLSRSFEQSVIDVVSGAYSSDLVVSSQRAASGFLEAPVDDQLSADIAAVGSVGSVVSNRTIDWNYGGGPIAINAFDRSYFREPTFGRWPLVGRRLPGVWEQVASGTSVIVSSNFVLNLGVDVGDTIVLDTPSGPLELRIAGVTVDFASPRGTLEITREVYKRYWRDNHVTRVFVNLDPGADPATVRAAIAAQLGTAYGLRILSSRELLGYFAEQVRRAFAPVTILAVMILLVVVLAVADTLAASVADRTRELGAIRAVGVERRHLGRMVLAEGLALGVLGLILAIGAGVGLATLWVEATFPYLLGWVLELHIPYGRAAFMAALTLVICLGAALSQALRAARLQPAVALRYE